MKKMVIVKQHDLKDCGVVCLSSIIQYYGGFVPMEKLRLDTNTNLEGTTAYNLLNAAKKYGFDVKGIKVDSFNNSKIILPAIAHLEYKNGLRHFVVIYGFTKSKVILMDPAKGKVVMRQDEFKDIFTNVLLLFYPKQKIMYIAKEKSIMHTFLQILSREKTLFWQIIAFSFLLMLFSILSSYYFKIGIESISSNSYKENLKIIVFAFFVITVLKCLFTYLRNYLESHLNKNIDVILLSEFINHIFHIPSNSLGSRTSGEIVTRVGELTNIKSLYTEIFVSFLLDFMLTITIIPILLSINNKLFLILFFIVLIYLLIGGCTTKMIYSKAYRNIELEEEFNNVLLENVKSFSSIRSLNNTDYALGKIEEKLSLLIHDNFRLTLFLNKDKNIKNFVSEIGLFMINSLGFYYIYKGTLNISSLITFNSLVSFFLTPAKNLVDLVPKYNFLKATLDKISEFINIEEEKLGVEKSLVNNDIKVKNLSYSYNDYLNVIKNQDFYIAKNSFVMLKGQSGSGKSTFCKMLTKDISNYGGSIIIGNKNLKDYTLSTIRKDVLYVSQNESLFHDTIMNNLLLGREVSEKFFNKVTNICMLNNIIDKKPLRYDTIISNDLESLSGGECQRIILARALFKDAKIIILDESLSEVDYNLERKIIQNIKKGFKDKTIIYITHKKQDDLFDQVIYFPEVVHD